MKLCKDCKFYEPAFVSQKAYSEAVCYAYKETVIDRVTGIEHVYAGESPYIMRHDKMKCGPNGDWWVEKEEGEVNVNGS